MGSMDRVDDRTFRVNFTGDGINKLREIINDKLKEFMGDYTDDTLVEYVIVLLRNGRRKEEARNELHVFLGDDSNSFVSWLWDHLASNLDLYVQSQDTGDATKPKPTQVDQVGRNESHHIDPESGKVKSDNLPRSRHKREWKALARDTMDPPPLRSSDVHGVYVEEKHDHEASHAGRSPSPQPPQQKKRSRQDERHHLKSEVVSHGTITAPRRLLQFAVQDAVGTLRPSFMVKEPSLKRLRSVVSTSTAESSLVDRPKRIQSIAKFSNPMSAVIKAVQEAAEDVKIKSSRNVFDRLGREMDVSKTAEQIRGVRDNILEDEVEVIEEFNQRSEQTRSIHLQKHGYAGHGGNIGIMENETGLAGDSMFDNEVYEEDDVMGHGVMVVSESGTSCGNKEDTLLVHSNVGKSADEIRVTQIKDQDPPISAKKVSANNSMNLNTWKPPYYQKSRGFAEKSNWNSSQRNEVERSGSQVMKENMVGSENGKAVADIHKESKKMLQFVPSSYPSGRPLEDADSRTIFVSNVHFAATKDSLSRHFNKFGDVLKVVILTDAATGQPKGSAYVEFLRKEAADNALSLDGTSFMSRILKVVKRSPANQEATTNTNMTRPRVTRGSPCTASRFGRVAFPRGIPAAFRPRIPMKPGGRSFQWKRDAQPTPAETVAPISAVRSLTYVRTEPKPDENSGAT